MSDMADPTILIIDDSPEIIEILDAVLSPEYRVVAAINGMTGLRLAAQRPQPSLILLDVVMPEMDGYAVLAKLRENPVTCAIPVVFLTALSREDEEERGLEVGVADYIPKPIKPAVLRARVRSQIEAKQTRDWLKSQSAAQDRETDSPLRDETALSEHAAILALAQLAEARDPTLGRHIPRTQRYVEILARQLQANVRFAKLLTESYIDMLRRAAPLHDIGKIVVPDAILLKPGRLTPEERDIMKTHAKAGAQALACAGKNIDPPLVFMKIAEDIARWHHEWWNGSGYPDGLKGDAIPLGARLMALADVFDALISRRPYKEPLPIEEARDIVVAGRGTQFDPDVVGAFIAKFDDFVSVAGQLRDDV